MKPKLLKNIARELRFVRARNVRITENSVTFSGRFLNLIMTWILPYAITYGEIRVEQDAEYLAVHYRVTFSNLLVAATLIIISVGVIVRELECPLNTMVFIMLFGWFWIVGFHSFYSIIKFRAFIKRNIRWAGVCLK